MRSNPPGYTNVTHGKPLVVSETNKLPDAATISAQPLYSYFMIWGVRLTQDNTPTDLTNTYNDTRVVSRGSVSAITFCIGSKDPEADFLSVSGGFKH
ncbi:hypothetical protein [Paenibacillus cymbidii]|uniref:hypothetical protein n=1 Tax=Paenibacillus cymbidii TaxID=1639034 RepID=UPI0010820500|nr:hypothetical protein [Paenibacillus cymbidii]